MRLATADSWLIDRQEAIKKKQEDKAMQAAIKKKKESDIKKRQKEVNRRMQPALRATCRRNDDEVFNPAVSRPLLHTWLCRHDQCKLGNRIENGVQPQSVHMRI